MTTREGEFIPLLAMNTWLAFSLFTPGAEVNGVRSPSLGMGKLYVEEWILENNSQH